MKLWIDDIRPAPNFGYIHTYSVNMAKQIICDIENHRYGNKTLTLIDIDHDAGEFARFGGDYIKLLEWLEATGRNYPIRIHSMNPVGVENMRRIIQRNGWKEIR